MPDTPDIPDLEATDRELLEGLMQHGLDRRRLLQLFGAGASLTAFSGTAGAGHEPGHEPRIDDHYGYAAPSDERLPGKLRPDHTVELHIHEHAIFSPDPTDVPFHFTPMGLHIDPGDIVRFDFETPEHTVTAYHPGQGRMNRVPNDVPPFSSPVINAGGFWLYQFDSPGTYDLFCAPHEFFGMVMRLVVGDPDGDAYDGSFEPTGRPPVSRAELSLLGITAFPNPTPNAVFQTDAMSVDAIVTAGDTGVSVDAVEDDLDDLPIVTTLIPSEVGGNSTDAEFDVTWGVSDPAGNLDQLELVLLDTSSSPPGPEGSPATESVAGSTDSGTTTLTASDDEDSGHSYVVRATVNDTAGNESSAAVPVTETDP